MLTRRMLRGKLSLTARCREYDSSIRTSTRMKRKTMQHQRIEFPILEDTTDECGCRHVAIQTTVTGNNKDGYKAAERQAHEWFFRNYDTNARVFKKYMDHELLIEQFLKSGQLNPAWLEASHPMLDLGEYIVRFGNHTGINPSSPEETWAFSFEIDPIMVLN